METMMEILQFVLLSLTMFTRSNHASQSVQCFTDYVKNVTCEWDGKCLSNNVRVHVGPDTKCTLHGNIPDQKGQTCELKSLDGPESSNLRGCSLSFRGSNPIGFDQMISLVVKCENYTEPVAQHSGFRSDLNIKLHPPEKLVIDRVNISWSLGSPHSRKIKDYAFQLQYMQADQSWENITIRHSTTWVELPEENLELGGQYLVRVRAWPSDDYLPYENDNTQWSEWSPTTTWISTVGKKEKKKPEVSDPAVLLTVGFGTLAVVLFLFTVLFKSQRISWVHKIKFPYIPDPSKFFVGLYSDHDGNFKNWLGPFLAPETFTSVQTEDISPVEVSEASDRHSALFRKECGSSSQLEKLDSSGQSSRFSNILYLYSHGSGSLSDKLDPCSALSPYRAAGGHGEGGTHVTQGGSGGVLGPLEMSSSYEHLEKLRREAQSPDSGFAGRSEDQESQEEVEEDKEPVEITQCLSDPPEFAPSCRMPLSTVFLHHAMPCFSGLPFALSGFELDPALLMASSGAIEPSSGGYKPVKDVQSEAL